MFNCCNPFCIKMQDLKLIISTNPCLCGNIISIIASPAAGTYCTLHHHTHQLLVLHFTPSYPPERLNELDICDGHESLSLWKHNFYYCITSCWYVLHFTPSYPPVAGIALYTIIPTSCWYCTLHHHTHQLLVLHFTPSYPPVAGIALAPSCPPAAGIALYTIIPTSCWYCLYTIIPTSAGIALYTIIPTSCWYCLYTIIPTSAGIALYTIIPTSCWYCTCTIIPTSCWYCLYTIIPTSC